MAPSSNIEAVTALKQKAALAFNTTDYQLAISYTNEAIQLLGSEHGSSVAQEESRLRSNLAAAYVELGMYKDAAAQARRAIDLDPSWHRPYLRLCTALAGVGDLADATAGVLHRGLQACQDPSQLRELQEALAALLEPCCSSAAHRSNGPHAAVPRSPTRAAACTETAGARATAISAIASSKRPRHDCVSAVRQHAEHCGTLPVTALCGFLGAGKTTLVRHLLSCMGSGAASRVGLLVNDLAPLNVDAQLLAMPPAEQLLAAAPSQVSAPPHAPPAPAELVELSNGCVCCNLAGEMQATLRCLAARTPPLEHIVVECTGVGEPAALAAAVQALEAEGAAGAAAAAAGMCGSGSSSGSGPLNDYPSAAAVTGDGTARDCGHEAAGHGEVRRRLVLQRMVTVVDASSFLQLMAGDTRGPAGGPDTPTGLEEAGVQPGCGGGGDTAAGSAPAADSAPAAAAAPGRRPLASLLAQQVEGADIVLLNKCDRLLDGIKLQRKERRGAQQRQQERHPHARPGQEGSPCDGVECDAQAPGPGLEPRRLQAEGLAAGRAVAATGALGAAGTQGGIGAAEAAEARRELGRVVALVRALNPDAQVLPCVRCEVPLDAVLGGGSCSAAKRRRPLLGVPAASANAAVAQAGPGGRHASGGGNSQGSDAAGSVAVERRTGGDAEAAAGAGEGGVGEGAHEEEEYGIGSYVFRSRRPFHPGRMWALLQALAASAEGSAEAGATADGQGGAAQQPLKPAAETDGGATCSGLHVPRGEVPGAGERTAAAADCSGLPALPHTPPLLLRAKGLFWIASLPQAVWELSLAGREVEVAAVGRWLCTMVDPEHWPVGRRGRSPQPRGTQAEECVAGPIQNGRLNTAQHVGAGQAASSGQGNRAEEAGGRGSAPWHPQWGDRENGLVFIGLGLARGDAPAVAERGGGIGADACVEGIVANVSELERLEALLRWAQLTSNEEAEGEEAWESWDDASWLGLLEQY